MSPRRRIPPNAPAAPPAPPAPRRPPGRRVVLLAAVAVPVIIAAIVVSMLMLVSHESQRRTALREVAVLDTARSFTVEFMSPDPTGEYGANRYVDRMTGQVTGDFATWWEEARDDILIQVAKGPQVVATVLYAGVERWNDDGSADVLVVARQDIKDDDGKTIGEPVDRVLENLRWEGDRWKISNLSPVW